MKHRYQRPENEAEFVLTPSQGTGTKLSGAAVIGDVDRLRDELSGMDATVIDASGLSAIDTAGAWALLEHRDRLEHAGQTLQLEGLAPHHARLLETVERSLPSEPPPQPKAGLTEWLEEIGRSVGQATVGLLGLLSLAGATLSHIAGYLIRPRRLRLTSLVFHMQEVGLNAVPIVSLMAFLIGVVLAFQGASQLRQFGAEIFVVDLIAVSILRELGILLTAIIVAGRSASAFTAAIGSMKMREEIDAMRTLGLDPIDLLVVPRVLALVLMLPILGFIANITGLVGGALMSWIELGVSPGVFATRLLDATDYWHYLIGMIKAPFFALIIGLIGCQQGLSVEGNAESLGRLTSRSVVQAIFTVIVADAAFSVFFALVGL